MQTVLIRYGEIAIKSGPVRSRFEDILITNIRTGLKSQNADHKIRKDFGRIFLETENPERAFPVLERTFGIVSFSPCRKTDHKLENIIHLSLKTARETLGSGDTFAVRARRIGEHPYTSRQVNEKVGQKIVDTLENPVDLDRPERTIYIEVRDRTAYIYTQKIPGPGGLPLGTQGQVLSLVTGPLGLVSTWLLMKRGCTPELITLKMEPEQEKKIISTLENWSSGRKIHHQRIENLTKINSIPQEKPLVTDFTLEDLDQVQKLKNQLKIPIFNPLIGLGKEKTKELEREINQ